ncbi:DUF3365 domain-containing protein [Acetobacter sp. DsW_063]|uniref:c-type heme family protein n=1 Tax=Acetobacter sp. DsW_063 TaxID=1514894 RepID=UPI000A369888|nr:DUF3365 domain-containing protein [Acetobacter sp. DsW_063]
MTLRLKVNIAFAAVAAAGLVLLWFVLGYSLSGDRITEATREARILTAQADAIAQYTDKEVAPLLSGADRGGALFLPPAASFYAVEANAKLLEKLAPGVRLRRVVLDPTNADDTPDEWERDAISELRGPRDGQQFTEVTPDGSIALVTPLKMRPGACATCYSSLDAAPAGVRDAFGGAKGFNRQPGEIVGATIATVSLPPTSSAFYWTFGAVACIILALWVAANVVLELLVLRPIARVSAIAESVSLGRAGVVEFDVPKTGELSILTASFNRLRRSMESAMALLES